MFDPFPSVPDVEEMSVDAYLASEPASPVRREFVVCRAWRYAETSVEHSLLVARIAAQLADPAEAAGCWIVAVNMRLKVGRDIFYYPDVMIGSESPPDDVEQVTEPLVVVEVVEQSTERTDRAEKLIVYRSMPSVQGYIIFDATQPRVDAWWRGPDGAWLHEAYGRDDWLSLPPLNAEVSVERIYAGIL